MTIDRTPAKTQVLGFPHSSSGRKLMKAATVIAAVFSFLSPPAGSYVGTVRASDDDGDLDRYFLHGVELTEAVSEG
ncbi:hypothetical protein E2C01_090302 [Portunus trituberculatus]|uniref:Uncharacterized protein n=1 Tax=Portunus trituberculatus TaxID=210409 RepID=A0A5B7JLG8_PORTR|nr:hypothetical protein [Portunus trituberculatus]